MKTYVITGATSGIGRALLEEFSKEGVVFAGYRNPKYEAELASMKNVIPFFILINGAGCVIAGAMEHMGASRLRRQFEVNTFSHLEFTQNLLPLLENGRVINISSMASFGIFPFVAPYCASKRALDILFSAMSVEMQGKLKVISVKPGVIATPLWEKSIDLNKNALENDTKYSKEMHFMEANALKNGKKGLPVSKVTALIKKITAAKDPKISYTIGLDAFVAEQISKLPPDIINKLMQLGLKKRISSV